MKQSQRIHQALSAHRAHLIEPGRRTHAAVALILLEQGGGLDILFIERAANDHDLWSREIGCPGGRMGPAKAAADTAAAPAVA